MNGLLMYGNILHLPRWAQLLIAIVGMILCLIWRRHVTREVREGSRFIDEIARAEKMTLFGATVEERRQARDELLKMARLAHDTRNPWIKHRRIAETMLDHVEHIAHSSVHLNDLNEDDARAWQEEIIRLVKPILYFKNPRIEARLRRCNIQKELNK